MKDYISCKILIGKETKIIEEVLNGE